MTSPNCPKCGDECWREEVDVGIGIVTGPWGCLSCGWSESPEYECSEEWVAGKPKVAKSGGGIVSPTGRLQPMGGLSSCSTPEEALAEADRRGYGDDFLPLD